MLRYPILTVLLALTLSAVPAFARARHAVPHVVPKPRPHVERTDTHARAKAHKPAITRTDMSKALPLSEMGKMPTTEERYRSLRSQVDKTKPDVESARHTSEALKAEAASLRQKLIETAARVQTLEQQKVRLDAQIRTLSARESEMAESFAHDRVAVAHLLGILERLQHDMPPAIVLNARNALGAAHAAMLLGASLPRVYGAAADLARRLEALRRTRTQLVAHRAESARNAVQLAAARVRLNQLLATKQAEATSATARYDTLAAKFEVIAKQATDLGQLLRRVAHLRAQRPDTNAVVVVDPAHRKAGFHLRRGELQRPVVGDLLDGGIKGVGGARAPGVTFLTQTGAQVVAPADSRVLFAGRYHKTGKVLILEMAAGYDLVLAGLDRLDVKVGDQLLAGEPLGTMPLTGKGAKLYFELRHNGKGTSPAPWLEPSIRKAERS